MTIRAKHVGGHLVPETPLQLAEGQEVTIEVEPVEPVKENDTATAGGSTIYDSLKDLIGKAEGLPSDASLNVDHYLYGLPKRQWPEKS